jgi:membrane protein required for colicin V production
MTYNWFDISLLLLLLFSVISGLRSGFARVTIGLVSTLAGLLLALWSYRIPAAWFRPYVSSDTIANVIGFLLIFVAVSVFGALVAAALATLFKWIGLSWFDHLLGGAVGFVRGALVIAALVAALVAFAPSPTPAFLNESRILPYAQHIAYMVIAAAPRDVKDAFDKQLDDIKHYWQELPGQKPKQTGGEV